ncbi:MAG: hypothetical protein MO847_05695 [Candidatus Protistobacter heckmanni]|nr:hypothetical protein [Candidatus Protistobacter heckmanni]
MRKTALLALLLSAGIAATSNANAAVPSKVHPFMAKQSFCSKQKMIDYSQAIRTAVSKFGPDILFVQTTGLSKGDAAILEKANVMLHMYMACVNGFAYR